MSQIIASANQPDKVAVSYCDYLALLLRHPLDRATLIRLRRLAPGFSYRPTQAFGFARRLYLPTPNRDALQVLADRLRPGRYCVSRLHIAIDLLTPEPDATLEWVAQHMVQRWPARQNHGVAYEDGFYARRGTAGRNIVVYSGRASKVAGTDCCHIEFRFESAKACRRLNDALGRTRDTDLSIADILALNRDVVWSVISNEVRVVDLDHSRLALALRNNSPEAQHRARQLIARFGFSLGWRCLRSALPDRPIAALLPARFAWVQCY